MRVLDAISEFLNKKSSVQMVADDPQLTSEMLLLVRMMFADGELSPAEMTLFKSLCGSAFGIPEEDVSDVIKFLRDVGYETSGQQAAKMFEFMPDERKQQVLGNVMAMARADMKVHANEVEMIGRIAKALGYDPDKVRALL
ncbi:MAG: TerB family tellurite resistance protein [Pseudomonadota bacterium]